MGGGEMKKWINEDYQFTITVTDGIWGPGDTHLRIGCRNGHEIGDTYTCQYGCPEPMNGEGGFCTKTIQKLYELEELIRHGKSPTAVDFKCADGCVTFRLQAENLAQIKPLTAADIPVYGEVIRKSFATVAKDFGWTRENAPGHTSFITNERLIEKYKAGYYPFGYVCNGEIFCFVSLTDMGDGAFELNDLAVLPEWRHLGYGKKLLDFCKAKVIELGGDKITLGIVEENAVVKDWYTANGFTHTGTQAFPHLPFVVGFMEWRT
jgi:uncharacterized repeat protein (TIGR04076 family)